MDYISRCHWSSVENGSSCLSVQAVYLCVMCCDLWRIFTIFKNTLVAMLARGTAVASHHRSGPANPQPVRPNPWSPPFFLVGLEITSRVFFNFLKFLCFLMFVVDRLTIFWFVSCFWLFVCQYQYKWLPGMIPLQNDLLCVDQDVKLYSHSLCCTCGIFTFWKNVSREAVW